MSAGQYNFTIEQGTYFVRAMTWTSSSTGAPINITGYTPRMQIRSRRGTLLLDCTPYLAVDGPSGKVTLTLPEAVTSALKFDTADYDLFLEDAQPRKLIKGLVRIDLATTR